MTVATAAKKVREMEGNFVEVYVMDYIARKRYFNDSEIAGWLLEEKDGLTEIYHLYRRADSETAEGLKEAMIYPDEQFTGKEKENQMWKMVKEVKLQHYTRENDEIFEKVKPFI